MKHLLAVRVKLGKAYLRIDFILYLMLKNAWLCFVTLACGMNSDKNFQVLCIDKMNCYVIDPGRPSCHATLHNVQTTVGKRH